MDLPRVDVHTVAVAASAERTWEALADWLGRGLPTPVSSRFARLLGCEQVDPQGTAGEPGSTVPGFRVARASAPRELAPRGRHRFSHYGLDFRVEDREPGRVLLSATTHAAFPGLKGELYKTAVIRSRPHVLATRRILHSVARRAEKGTLSR